MHPRAYIDTRLRVSQSACGNAHGETPFSLHRWLRYFVSLWTTNNSCSPIDTSLDEASADPASSACRNRLVSQALAVAGPISSRGSNNGSAIASNLAVVFHAAIRAAIRPTPRGCRTLFSFGTTNGAEREKPTENRRAAGL